MITAEDARKLIPEDEIQADLSDLEVFIKERAKLGYSYLNITYYDMHGSFKHKLSKLGYIVETSGDHITKILW